MNIRFQRSPSSLALRCSKEIDTENLSYRSSMSSFERLYLDPDSRIRLQEVGCIIDIACI
jgi:hypothetical protein